MAFFKKILDILYRYYDKIVLGILLLLLAVVMYFQGENLRKVKDKVQKMQQDTINQLMRKPDVKPFDAGTMKVDLDLDKSRIWKAAPVPGTHPPKGGPDSKLSAALLKHYETVGQGSLFDPIAYVVPIDDDPNFLGYSTVVSPFTKTNDVVSKSVPPRPPEGGELPRPPEGGELPKVTTTKAPIAYLRFRRATQDKLPLVLKSIRPDVLEDKTKWQVQINIIPRSGGQRSYFLHLDQEIGDSGYRLVDADYRYESPGPDKPKAEVITVTVKTADGEPITLQKDKQGEGGPTSFLIAYLNPSGEGKQYMVKTQEVFPVEAPASTPATPGTTATPGKTYYYKILDKDKATVDESKQLTAQETDKSGTPISGDKLTIPFISESALQKYLHPVEPAGATEAPSPTPGMSGGPGAMGGPGVMGGPGMLPTAPYPSPTLQPKPGPR